MEEITNEEKIKQENLTPVKPLGNKILNKLTKFIWGLFYEKKITSNEREYLLAVQEEIEKKIIREMQNELNDFLPHEKNKYYY